MVDDLQKKTTDWFSNLPPVLPAEMIGIWRGEGVPSGHPLDGVLENLQWFGKRFHHDLRADALLFQWRPGRLVPIDPTFFPPGLLSDSQRSAGHQLPETGSRTCRERSVPEARPHR